MEAREAIDYSEGMLEKARRRVEREGWSNVELVRGDAVKLEGVPAPVDAVISVWCLGIVYDLEAALDRAVDRLRPGGRLAIWTSADPCPSAAPLRLLSPIFHRILEQSGVDSAEDLDDEALRRRWDAGRRLLRRRLDDVYEGTYLQGGGLIIAGAKPAT